MDHHDALGLCVIGVFERVHLTFECDRTAGRGQITAQDFHRSGFARAVFADQRMYFARAQIQGNSVQHLNLTKTAAHIGEGEDWIVHTLVHAALFADDVTQALMKDIPSRPA